MNNSESKRQNGLDQAKQGNKYTKVFVVLDTGKGENFLVSDSNLKRWLTMDTSHALIFKRIKGGVISINLNHIVSLQIVK